VALSPPRHLPRTEQWFIGLETRSSARTAPRHLSPLAIEEIDKSSGTPPGAKTHHQHDRHPAPTGISPQRIWGSHRPFSSVKGCNQPNPRPPSTAKSPTLPTEGVEPGTPRNRGSLPANTVCKKAAEKSARPARAFAKNRHPRRLFDSASVGSPSANPIPIFSSSYTQFQKRRGYGLALPRSGDQHRGWFHFPCSPP